MVINDMKLLQVYLSQRNHKKVWRLRQLLRLAGVDTRGVKPAVCVHCGGTEEAKYPLALQVLGCKVHHTTGEFECAYCHGAHR
jgi:hypothetical protein